MSNILAIARKELRSYFASPIGYVLVGLWAFLFGYFYYFILEAFVRSSMQMPGMGGMQTMNINQDLLRPLMYNATILVLFVLPGVTMRTYSEEKRSGTIELLLTSPLTDFEIIMGKFLGAMALYSIMLMVTWIHIGMLYLYGSPEWKPLVVAYLGLLLLGGCFIAIGLFISSLTRNQVISFMVTFSIFLLLWVISWSANSAGPTTSEIIRYVSIVDQFDDFGKGVLDTTHLVYYVSFITFGLFLTAKSVDSERWRG
ncbi:MAG TPA: ABC transporter permease [Vicinamibacterales bacterium]|jgi:ABC-2 type transport system permease protein|nr:ABC transporter permease [Vicinamibacterales bacterium]